MEERAKDKSIKKNFVYNILLNISKVVFPLITAPYISRVLEPEGVGLFNFANTYANYFALFAAMGIPYYGVREISKIRYSKELQNNFFSEIFSLITISTLICIICFVCSLFFVPQLTENKIIFIVAALVLYTSPFQIDWFFKGNEEFGYITARSLTIKGISVLLLFIFVKEKEHLIYYVWITALSTVINEIWNFIKLYKLGIRPRFTINFKHHVKPMMILFSSAVAISIYTLLDTLMLGFLANYTEVGYYNSAVQISKNILPITTSLSAVALPRLASLSQNKNCEVINELMNKSLSIVAFLCFPIAIAIYILAPTFIPLFFGSLYEGAIIPLRIVILVVVAIGFNNIYGVQVLVGLGKDKLFLYSVLVGTISNFLLNLLLIPNYGSIGASIASVSAETFVLIICYVFVKRYTQIRTSACKDIIISALIPLSFFCINYYIKDFLTGWLYICCFTILCSVYYLIVQYICKNSTMTIFVNLVQNKMKK